MATSWITVRGDLATIFAGVAITTPIATTIKKVYQTPPTTTPEPPCIVIVGAAKQTRRLVALREKFYIAHCQLLVYDALTPTAMDILDEFQEALISTLDSHVNLSGDCSVIAGPNFDAPGFVDYSGKQFAAANFRLEIQLYDAVAFA